MEQIIGELIKLGPWGIFIATLLFGMSVAMWAIVKLYGDGQKSGTKVWEDREKVITAITSSTSVIADLTKTIERQADAIDDQAHASTDTARALSAMDTAFRDLKSRIEINLIGRI